MNYQPNFRNGHNVDPIPEPRALVRRLMLATAAAIDGPLEAQPERFDDRLKNCLLMMQAGLVITGTGCDQPLLVREAADLSAATNLDALVVRAVQEDRPVTFDLKTAGMDVALRKYRLWMSRPSEGGWLVPTSGEAVYVRLTPLGLEVEGRAPYRDEADRDFGLVHGTAYLSVAKQGWF